MGSVIAATKGIELVNVATSLVPYLHENAVQTENARQVPDETMRRLRDARLLEALVPQRYGGHEVDFVTMARIIAELGRGCGSTAWVYGVSATQNWIVATFAQEAQDEVWTDGPQVVISATFGPNPKVQTVKWADNGFRLSGRWGFASGCDHADWHLVQILAPAEGATPPSAYFALVPRSDFIIDDDWHVMGLTGTGSKTVVLNDVFVPRHRTLACNLTSTGETPGAALHANPIYAMPLTSVSPIGIASGLLGIARGALESLVAGAASGGRDSARGKFADNILVHGWIGEALADIEAAELVTFTALDELVATAKAGRRPSVEERVTFRRHYAFATRMCVQAANKIFTCTGASGIALNHQTQRAWRDINAAARHFGLNWEPYVAQAGRVALGLEPTGVF